MDTQKKPNGIQLLVEKLSYEFEVEENINYYSFKDFLRAKRKYIKFMVAGSCVPKVYRKRMARFSDGNKNGEYVEYETKYFMTKRYKAFFN